MKISKKVLDIEEIKKLIHDDETIEFMFVSNYTKVEGSSERGYCKNGHFVFISNYMSFDENTHTICQCDECDEIILEFKPFAVRRRELSKI